ncbi:MAG: SpoIIE family protein phosphatase [Janthinobacterium lividum]
MARAKLLLQEIETYAQNIGDTIRDPLLILDRDLRVKSANRSFYKTFQALPEDTEGCFIQELGNGEWNLPPLLDLLRDILPTKGHFDDFEVSHDFPKIGKKTMLLNARKLYRPGNRTVLLVLAIEDITERRKVEAQLAAVHQRDRRIASTLQRALLFMPDENAFPGIAVKMLHEPASDEALVGGDFWDIFAFDNGHVALVIGDVMGHGLTAAVFTAEIRFILRAFLREHEQPALVLNHLNAYVCESHRLFLEGLNAEGDDAPICLALAVIHAATGKGVVAVAGMERPLLLRATGQVEEVPVEGLLLGIETEQKFVSAAFQLELGDTILLTTDGITEARQGKEFLGNVGLQRLAQEAQPLHTLELTAQSILEGARTFAGGVFRDDVCLVLARRQ